MTEETPSTTTPTPPPKTSVSEGVGQFLTTPMAIVIAGAFIAIALYASGGTQKTAQNNPAPAAPAAPAASPTDSAAALVVNAKEVTAKDHIRGAENAKVTVIEYSDLECPFCKQFHTTLQQLMTEYPNDIRWVYRHFPLEQLHHQAPTEANAAECAAEQGKFWEFVDLVFKTTSGNDTLDLTTLPQLAKQAGVANIQQFQSCVDDNKYADVVQAGVTEAQNAGGRGTPYSILIGPDGTRIPINGAQSFQTVQGQIESLLKK